MKESRRDSVQIADFNCRINVLLHVDEVLHVVLHQVSEKREFRAEVVNVGFHDQVNCDREQIVSG